MGVSTQDLMKEKYVLNKSFNDLNTKIQTIEKELGTMRNNLNALNGAIQIVDKMIAQDENFDPKTGQFKVSSNGTLPADGNFAKEKIDNDNVKKVQKQLEIKEKEEAELLNEGDKWKKISTVF